MSTVSLRPSRTAVRPAVAAGGVAITPARVALAGIAAMAAILRLDGLGSMPPNPFYDAAVRSMGSSWHAFIVGAFNPNASVAVDKPPLDLWVQVASTKLFGFSAFALHLPQALASVAAVVLLYDLVRRGFGRTAGLAAAAAFAVLPVEVMTARSDTMDAWMAMLLLLAAWLVVRALEQRRARELYLAGVAVGLAFETKLFEALVPLPALVLLFLLGSDPRFHKRARELGRAGLVIVATGLAWPLLFAAVQMRRVPYPLGSSSGSIWDTVFIYNGIGRLTGTSTSSAADRLNQPGLTRLFTGGASHLDRLVGTSLLAALVLAVVAIALGTVSRRSLGRLPFAIATAMGVWLLLAGLLLSLLQHAPVRYLELLAPAVAGVFGIALTLVAGRVAHLLSGRRETRRRIAIVLASSAAAAALAAPASQSVALVDARSGDGGSLGALPLTTIARLSRFLEGHQGSTRYEFAVGEAHIAGPLIAADARPVMVLAGTPYHQLIGEHRLAAAVRAGTVRYVLLSSSTRSQRVRPSLHAHTARGRMAGWVRAHGVDVSRQAGLPGFGALYRLTPQTVQPLRAAGSG
jgi:4-amino-4-deoxy-L-arabinose transferase-like glycosyltransferase